MKKQKIQLIVLLIILGAALIAYFAIRGAAKKKETEENTAKYTAFSLDPDDITRLEVHNQAGSFMLDYDSSSKKWTFEDLTNETVDNSQAQLLADALKSVSSDNEITNVTDPEDYGFSGTPAITIDVTMKDGTETTLYVGDENKTISEYYFRVGNADTIYTVSSDFFSTFNVDPTSLISSDGAETSSSSGVSPSASSASASG